ncbi:MFS transporter [Marinagarivorans cellulosilyticus]|uniref:MFS transporter n=1 Tax=Marinagarivorans cellulosilyticus TaxID=2721545 RepID=UPI001F2DF1A9|nr:MFS transporter [Marinagarivorans cellulosilyticus]
MLTTFKTANIYLDRRIISIFLLGIISGLPWVMIGSALTLWLQEAGLSRSSIGFAGLIFAVYSINFLWAPLVDRFSLARVLGTRNKTGNKQSWIITCQIIIACCCLSMSLFAPTDAAKTLILIALILACASATQDIAIDAYRVQSFKPQEKALISAGAAAATGGWWTGYAAIGFIPLALSDVGWSWPSLYLLLATITAITTVLCILMPAAQTTTSQPEAAALLLPQCRSKIHQKALLLLMALPWCIAIWAVGGWGIPAGFKQSQGFIPVIIAIEIFLAGFLLHTLSQLPSQGLSHAASFNEKLLANTYHTLILPLRDFFMRNGPAIAISLLGFIFLFKIGEAFLGRMSIVFYKEIGFSKTQIATYSKMLTWLVTMACVIPCGILNARLGLLKGLMVSGLFMAASNLMFCLLAIAGPVEWLYFVTVVIDGFTSAWATVAFVAFISHLCSHQFSATQYALLASLGNLGRTLLASNSGLLVDIFNGDWALFFAITALMVTPSLVLLWRLRFKLLTLRND